MVGITKLKAASLIEVLVSITVLMTVIIIGTMIFVNVTKSSFTGQKIKAQLMLERVLRDTKVTKSFFSEEFNEDGILIKRIIEPYEKSEHLITISIRAFDHNETLLGEKLYVYKPEE